MAKYLTFNLVDCMYSWQSDISSIEVLEKARSVVNPAHCFLYHKVVQKSNSTRNKKTGTNQVHTDELRSKIGLYMYAAETILNDLTPK